MRDKVLSLEEAASLVQDGCLIAFGGSFLRRKPIALVRALIRRKVKDLRLLACLASLEFDLLIGAGAVKATHAIYVGFEQLGMAPSFSRLAKAGALEVNEYSEFMLMFGLKAANMGLPFLPTRAGLGSDVTRLRNLKFIDCPYTRAPLLALPAINPDIAVIHALRSDPYGNVQFPPTRDASTSDLVFARAAKQVLVTVEEIVSPERFREHATDTALFHWEVTAVVEAPRGAHPTAYWPLYEMDVEQCSMYLRLAQTSEGFQQYLERYVLKSDGRLDVGGEVAGSGGHEELRD